MKNEETYYELLKVDRRATVADIVAAYHAAKNAFSKDSVASYSLFSSEETDVFLKKLEEAYLTLSNLDRKREYDKNLDQGSPQEPVAVPSPKPQATKVVPFPVPQAKETAPVHEPAALTERPTESVTINGAYLKSSREQKGMTLEDVCRLTKIPTRTLKAIENDDKKTIPARVYLQGFVTNLAKLYRLDATATTRGYLQNIDKVL